MCVSNTPAPHHVVWWRHGGGSDLANLIPLCVRHHHRVHDGGWQLELDPSNRHLKVALPDGTQLDGPITSRTNHVASSRSTDRSPPRTRAG